MFIEQSLEEKVYLLRNDTFIRTTASGPSRLIREPFAITLYALCGELSKDQREAVAEQYNLLGGPLITFSSCWDSSTELFSTM